MCEYAEKLVAWMDGELAASRMAEVERHLTECGECRGRVARYREVSEAVTAYCILTEETKISSKGTSARAAVVLAAAAVLVLAGGMVFHQPRVEPAHLRAAETTAASAITHEAPAAPERPVLERRAAGKAKPQHPRGARRDTGMPSGPAIQIAIPAESMFPPGAVPEGINFAADVSFGPDGVARQIRLRPQLTEFAGRMMQQ
jgi:hypothetical protein